MPKGKLPRNDPPVTIHVYLPQSLVTRLNLAIWDPKHGKPMYGARGLIIGNAIQEWLDRRDATLNNEQETPSVPNP
jgi:hypothetical protein